MAYIDLSNLNLA